MTPKEHFQELDSSILRMLLKVAVVAKALEDRPSAVPVMHRIERLTRHFVRLFISLTRGEHPLILPGPAEECPMIDTMARLRDSLLSLSNGQLSEKSLQRIHFVFEDMCDRSLWQRIFDPRASQDEVTLRANLANSFERVLIARLL